MIVPQTNVTLETEKSMSYIDSRTEALQTRHTGSAMGSSVADIYSSQLQKFLKQSVDLEDLQKIPEAALSKSRILTQ